LKINQNKGTKPITKSITNPLNQPLEKKQLRRPSVIDQIPDYDIANDILQTKANVTLGQMLRIPKQRTNFSKLLKRPSQNPNESGTKMSANYGNANVKKTMPIKFFVRIRNNSILGIVDSGAATCIISKPMMKALGLRASSASNIIIVGIGGTKNRSLGQVENVPVAIGSTIMSVTFQLNDSPEKLLIFGTDWISRTKAVVDAGKESLTITHGGKKITVSIYIEKGQETRSREVHFEEDEESDQEFDTIVRELQEEPYEYEEEEVEELHSYYFEIKDQAEGLALMQEKDDVDSDDEEEVMLAEVRLDEESFKIEKESGKIKPLDVGPMTQHQQGQALQLFQKYKGMFASDISELRQTNVVEHTIELLPDAKPVKRTLYSMSPEQRNFLQKELNHMLEKGLIRASSSPWGCSPLIVPKKGPKSGDSVLIIVH